MQGFPITIFPQTRILFIQSGALEPYMALWKLEVEQLSLYVRLDREYAAPGEVITAINAALQATQRHIQWIIVDEVDRLDRHTLVATLRELVNWPARFLLIGREIPFELLLAADLKGRVQVVSPLLNDAFYTTEEDRDRRAILDVRAFGLGRVMLNGKLIESWDGILPRLLFFFFIDKGMVTRDEIFATFWRNMSVKEATNVFHVTKRKINEVLGMDLTLYRSGYYCISPDILLNYDVLEFNQKLQDAEVAEADSVEKLLLETIHLYRGDFLSSTDFPWVVQRRDEMRQAYGGALFALGQVYRDSGKAALAENYFLKAYRYSPGDTRFEQEVRHLIAGV
jgi:tetratricopeptide (TPR) repeat protein